MKRRPAPLPPTPAELDYWRMLLEEKPAPLPPTPTELDYVRMLREAKMRS